MTPTLTLTLPLLSPSQNTYQRSHWLERHKLVGQYRKLIGHRLSELLAHDPEALVLWPPVPAKKVKGAPRREGPAKRKVEVTRMGKRQLDYGNLVGGCKPLIDALVAEGVLYDDSPDWLEDKYLQATSRGRTAVKVEVWV